MTNCKITATKEFVWDMAHLLPGHNGLCKNLHGHTYKLQVTVSNTESVIIGGPSAGMVIDFKHLKEIVNSVIVDRYDHAVVLQRQSGDAFESALIDLCILHKKKMVLTHYRTTAENMVRDFAWQIGQALEDLGQGKLVLEKVRLYETPTSYAEWIRED